MLVFISVPCVHVESIFIPQLKIFLQLIFFYNQLLCYLFQYFSRISICQFPVLLMFISLFLLPLFIFLCPKSPVILFYFFLSTLHHQRKFRRIYQLFKGLYIRRIMYFLFFIFSDRIIYVSVK